MKKQTRNIGPQGESAKHNKISNLVELGKKFCLPQLEKANTSPLPLSDLRTDGAKRIRIASRLSRLEQSSIGETLGAWSKSKTGEGAVKAAFTLAEVLITLGVIGVVAAMTLPTVVKNFQRKTLEARYKKSISFISQALLKTQNELGIEKFADYCTYYPYSDNIHEYPHAQECYAALYGNIIKIQTTNKIQTNWVQDKLQRREEIIKTYNSKQTIMQHDLASRGNVIFFINVMPDGSFLNYCIMEFLLLVGVDTNGKKAPNKLGHDIFVFEVDKTKNILSSRVTDKYHCNLTSEQKGNGIGCAYYALKDECPYDKSKKYFECLP